MKEPASARPALALHPASRFKLARALILLALALAAGLLTDWLRNERVVFARPLPEITMEPAP